MRKGFAAILILGVVLAVLVLGTTIYLKQTQKPQSVVNQVTIPKKITKPSSSTTQSDETANWKTYENKEAGYKINYPKSWTFKSSPASSEFEYARDSFIGKEGTILIDYGTGLGGGCGPGQEGELKIKNTTLSVCITSPDHDGGKTYSILGAVSGAKNISWRGFITVNKPIETNEKVVLTVSETLETIK